MAKRKRDSWGDLETDFMLSVMRDKNIAGMLDGKRYRNTDIYKIVEEELKKRGFQKTPDQIRAKWKKLKSQYHQSVLNNSVSGRERTECPHWEILQELLAKRPISEMDASNSIDSAGCFETIFFYEDGDMIIPNSSSDNSTATEEANIDSEGASNTSTTTTSGHPSKKRKATQSTPEEMIEQQRKMIREEMQLQMEMEREILREERQANEAFMTSMMANFVTNMARFSSPPAAYCQVPYYIPTPGGPMSQPPSAPSPAPGSPMSQPPSAPSSAGSPNDINNEMHTTQFKN